MKILISGLLLLIIILACQPQNIRRLRAVEQKASPDSFLFYQPVSAQDTFLDSLKSVYDQEVSLALRLIPPPPPPPPKIKQIEGFRVQIFAGLDSINAAITKQELQNSVNDSIYFFKEKGLFKVQLGDYPYRNPADLKVLDLRKNGFMDGWVVQRLINVPVDSVSKINKSSAVNGTRYDFKIQVMATSDKNKAERLVQQLKEKFGQDTYFESAGIVYKVFVGRLETRDAAETVLKKVKDAGYKDAWINH